MEAVRGQKHSSKAKKGMKELIYWKKYLLRVSLQPQKPLNGSDQIWAKGQLILKCPFGVILWTKIPTKNLKNSALEFEKWSNHKTKALYNVSNTLNSPYNNTAWTINDVLVDTYPFIILVDPHPFRVDPFISLKGCESTKIIKGYGSTKTSLTVQTVCEL